LVWSFVSTTGQVFYEAQVSDFTGELTQTVDVTDFPTGVWILRVQQGGEIYTKTLLRVGFR
jgi:hypothetical protein